MRLTIEPIELGTSVNRSTERSWRQESLLQEDFGDIISLCVRLIISNASIVKCETLSQISNTLHFSTVDSLVRTTLHARLSSFFLKVIVICFS